MTERFRLPILEQDREVSHLAGRLDLPPGSRALFTILYLHGFGSSHSGEKADFFRQRALQAGLAVCSFDFQGHGESGGGMLELTLSRNLADAHLVHGWLRERSLDKVVLLGSSMGGLTGLWYSARYPQDVFCGLYLAPALGLLETIAADAGSEGLRRWREEGSTLVKHELGSWDLGWSFVEELRRFGPDGLIRDYRTPCLILQGKKDDRVPWRRVLDFATRCSFEEIELHLFADGDHRLIDRKERLWNLMLGFLSDRGYLKRMSRRSSPASSST